jgi:DNA-binding CsgD family transcriptional regulator
MMEIQPLHPVIQWAKQKTPLSKQQLELFCLLVEGEKTVAQLAVRMGITKKHISVLLPQVEKKIGGIGLTLGKKPVGKVHSGTPKRYFLIEKPTK